MFSVQSGADVTYACEMSKPMYELAKDVLAANGMGESVNLFHKKSTDLKVGQDLDSRVDLVVTETVDAGLLGEHIVPTILHAWSELLQPAGQVIPAGATVYACGIESKAIRNQNRLLYSGIRHLDLSSLAIVCATGHDEVVQDPYTTEKLAMVRSGYKQLTAAHKILELDFNSPEDLKNSTCGALKEFKFPVIRSGRLDAIAMWFDLKLDTDVTFSTAPDSPTCWEQAVFPILHHHLAAAGVGHRENMTVKPDDVAIIVSQCLEDHIELRCCHIHHHDPSNETSIDTDSIEQITEAFLAMSPTNYDNETHKSMHFLERSVMGCLNNLRMNTAYCMAMETLKAKNHARLQLFDLNSGFSPLGLQALKLGFLHVFLMSDEHRMLLSAIAEGNKISMDQVTFTGRNFDELGINCDIILSEIVEPCGALRQQVLEDVALARLQCMDREGHVVPNQVTAYGMVIESQSLLQDSQVKDGDATTLGLEVAKFMNDFQMTTHVDIDLLTLPHTRLTAPFKLLTLNLNEKSTRNVPSFLEQENLHKVEVIKDGRATAVLYWFDFTLIDNIKLCTLDTDSHWKQAAVMVKTTKVLKTGDKLSVRVILKNSCIDIKLE
ncbi:protein arginine N-methyltransferase 9-like isoform X2 [Lineus longissimus]